jgi:hypothetical protein
VNLQGDTDFIHAELRVATEDSDSAKVGSWVIRRLDQNLDGQALEYGTGGDEADASFGQVPRSGRFLANARTLAIEDPHITWGTKLPSVSSPSALPFPIRLVQRGPLLGEFVELIHNDLQRRILFLRLVRHLRFTS